MFFGAVAELKAISCLTRDLAQHWKDNKTTARDVLRTQVPDGVIWWNVRNLKYISNKFNYWRTLAIIFNHYCYI